MDVVRHENVTTDEDIPIQRLATELEKRVVDWFCGEQGLAFGDAARDEVNGVGVVNLFEAVEALGHRRSKENLRRS
jgi:hypothetical protein